MAVHDVFDAFRAYAREHGGEVWEDEGDVFYRKAPLSVKSNAHGTSVIVDGTRGFRRHYAVEDPAVVQRLLAGETQGVESAAEFFNYLVREETGTMLMEFSEQFDDVSFRFDDGYIANCRSGDELLRVRTYPDTFAGDGIAVNVQSFAANDPVGLGSRHRVLPTRYANSIHVIPRNAASLEMYVDACLGRSEDMSHTLQGWANTLQ